MSELAKKKSQIWKHFAIINKDKAKCEYCLKIISYSGGGTGNLNRHLKKVHPTVSIETLLPTRTILTNAEVGSIVPPTSQDSGSEAGPTVPSTSQEIVSTSATTLIQHQTTGPAVQLSIEHFTKSTRPLPINKTKQLDEQVVKFIVKGYHAFSVVEEPEFKSMFKMILPTYNLPTRKTISTSLIPKLYQTTKEKVLQLVADADAICLTTDGWTSLNNVSFMGLTAHFINSNSTLQSVLLGCIQFDDRHTAENLSNFLLQEASNWGISHKISGVITDSAPNIVSAIRLTKWRHFSCFAHSVNLVVQHSLDTLKDQLEKVKNIVQYFKHSSTAASKLQAMQIQMGLAPLKLKQSVVTRWNSTYDMLDRLLKIKDAVVSTLAIVQPRLNTLTPDEWKLLEKCVEILKIFYNVTVEMSAEKSVSISKVMVLIKIMKSYVEKHIIESGTGQHLQLLYALRDELNRRFCDTESNVLVTEASLLDPRFKKHAFITTEKYDQCLRSVRGKIRSLFASNTPGSLLEPPSQISEQPSTSMWDEFDKQVEKEIIQNPTAGSIVEMDKYLNEPLIKRSDDPLKWWHERRLIYPNLYVLMKRRLCVPATSVPCERVFSKAGMTINQKRSSLKPEKASQLLFLNYNVE